MSFGTRVGGLTDPAGDDNGPGTYTYPTNSAFAKGGFDLTALDVFIDGDDAIFVAKIAGEIVNPWGGDEISHQRFNVYLGNGQTTTAHALPGTNLDTAGGWDVAVVGDGRFDSAGTYAPGATAPTVHGDMLAVAETHQIAVVVPACGARRDRPADRPLRRRDVRQRRGRRGPRLHPSRLRRRLLEQPAGRLQLDQGVPLRRRRGRLGRHARPRHRHPRPERDRRDRRLRPDPGAGPRLARRSRRRSCRCCASTSRPPAPARPAPSAARCPRRCRCRSAPRPRSAPFTPGADRTYDATTTATVTSSAGDATLSVTDPSSTATGRLVNGSFALDEPLQARASSAGGTGSSAFAPLSTTAGNPLTLLTYTGPIANDTVTIGFRQHIAANQALRTGNYAKTLTFTLSTTTP